MIKYIVTDASGVILRSGVCIIDSDAALQGRSPERVYAAEPSLYPTDHIDDTTYRVDMAANTLVAITDGAVLGSVSPAPDAS